MSERPLLPSEIRTIILNGKEPVVRFTAVAREMERAGEKIAGLDYGHSMLQEVLIINELLDLLAFVAGYGDIVDSFERLRHAVRHAEAD